MKNQPLNIEYLPISGLVPYENNTKLHPRPQIDQIKASIDKFGMNDPIAVDEKTLVIIEGHGRLIACKELGIKSVPVIKLGHLTKPQQDAYRIAHNKLTMNSDFDMEALEAEMRELKAADFDLALTGFSVNELKSMDLDFPVYNDPSKDDELPENPQNPILKTGDIIELGRHRLLCGDCTVKENYDALMQGKTANMVFTDPPYAVNYGADEECLNKKNKSRTHKTARLIKGDNLTTEQCAERIWRPAFKNMYDVAGDACSFYMTMCQGGDQMMMMMMMMKENWQIKHELIWVKNNPVFSMGRLDYDYQHEPILFGWKKKHTFYGKGEFQKSIWQIPRPAKSDLHPTMKPVELIENAINNSSLKGHAVLDPFLGSGSTLIACEKTNRTCYGMEIDPLYCDVITTRYCKFTENWNIKINGIDTDWKAAVELNKNSAPI